MTLDEAIKVADAALTHDWKTLTQEQRRAFSIVIDYAIAARDNCPTTEYHQ